MNDINKLPKWAKESIRHLQMERDEAVRALNKYLDEQSQSQFFTDDFLCTGEARGPVSKRRYIQASRCVAVKDGEHEFELGFDNDKQLTLRCTSGWLSLWPRASNSIGIKAHRL